MSENSLMTALQMGCVTIAARLAQGRPVLERDMADLLDQRRLMQDWAEFCDRLLAEGAMSDPTPSESLPPPADAYQVSEVALTDIRVFKRLRPLEPARVEALVASLGSEGLRHPIVVRRTPEGYHLILGRHRLEAARQLKWQTIRASIFFDMTEDQAALAEVEDNLVSRLTPDEYANLIASREEATEDRRDWKTAARRFFGLAKRDTAV
jgi:hypothetical protein